MAEGFICLAAFSLYLVTSDGAAWMSGNWDFYGPMAAGALLAAPIAARLTKLASSKVDLRLVVGLLTCVLGTWTLIKTFG